MKGKIIIAFFFFGCLLSSCYKNSGKTEEVLPTTYTEMFTALNLQQNKEYSYIERVNNAETGNKGKIRFSLSDTSMTETFNGYIVKDKFRLDSFKAYSCQFESLGRKKYNTNISRFINNASKDVSYVNGLMMVNFDSIENGSYYYYQYIIRE
ncbi:MAG: hypothetical protein EOO10_02180 [Chitinophagaceae bacterium]|nr:MAG: hypothetical protein EOO10_02180 [Chitinophagaceae bacterium]